MRRGEVTKAWAISDKNGTIFVRGIYTSKINAVKHMKEITLDTSWEVVPVEIRVVGK